MKNAIENDALCANCSRLLKYLMVDYTEEFSSGFRRYVVETVSLVPGSPLADAIVSSGARQTVMNLQLLYGTEVLPKIITDVLNRDLTSLEVVCPLGNDSRTICGTVYDLLYKHVMRIDSKPVVTRFWMFAHCIFALLLMKTLGLPASIFSTNLVQPQVANAARLARFKAWYVSPSSGSSLREAALCLRLTLHAINITAQKRTTPAGACRLPTLVRLGQSEVQRAASETLRDLLPRLHLDPQLDVSNAFWRLLVTQSHLVIRFREFLEYPTRLWRLCRRFNPDGYGYNVEMFLSAKTEELDVGYSLGLQADALSKGSHASGIAYMLTDAVQEEISGAFEHVDATALDIERKIKNDKDLEGRQGVKTMTAARAYCNSILHHYKLGCCTAQADNDKNKFMNACAIAIMRNPSRCSAVAQGNCIGKRVCAQWK